MTKMLQKAFAEVSKLPDAEQDLIASKLLMDLEAEQAFDDKIASTAHRLVGMARRAMEDDQAGRTKPLDPDEI